MHLIFEIILVILQNQSQFTIYPLRRGKCRINFAYQTIAFEHEIESVKLLFLLNRHSIIFLFLYILIKYLLKLQAANSIGGQEGTYKKIARLNLINKRITQSFQFTAHAWEAENEKELEQLKQNYFYYYKLVLLIYFQCSQCKMELFIFMDQVLEIYKNQTINKSLLRLMVKVIQQVQIKQMNQYFFNQMNNQCILKSLVKVNQLECVQEIKLINGNLIQNKKKLHNQIN
ncbi:unnamed protein product [Paramecium sonneborni]|uniref:Uncharacterized protein n=1 Tax=Paramecium sonneborni TaxID=65129 RepID=A0A8S1Q0A1_9CILI|nr:unnamed protein product [Paramecium sonneborni]CAD8108672.1 unnamed protein product [Paramecium sonneborni]